MDFETGIDEIHLIMEGGSDDWSLYWLGGSAFTGQDRLEVRFANGVLEVDRDGDTYADLIVSVVGTVVASDIRYTFDPWS